MLRWPLLLCLALGCSPAPRVAPPAAAAPHAAQVPPSPTVADPPPPVGPQQSEQPIEASSPRPEPDASEADLPDVSAEQLEHCIVSAPDRLGSLSLGSPNNGALFNGVQLSNNQYFNVVDPGHAWGTEETLAYLEAALSVVHREFPGSAPLYVGHLSAEHGGRLSPHSSHQSGRDVDLGYFYSTPGSWYRRATPKTLDLPRTWAVVRALITESDVEMIFIDHRLSRAIRDYAAQQGEDPAWLETVFDGDRGLGPIVRHARGHTTHMHVRFHNPRAQRMARRAYPLLVKHELIDKIQVYRYHRVRKGETLGKLAKQYGTTVQAIKRANGLRSTVIQAKKSYKIPTAWEAAPVSDAVEVPPRRLPPEL